MTDEESLADLNVTSLTDVSCNGKTDKSSAKTHAPWPIGQATVFNRTYAQVYMAALGTGLHTLSFWVHFAITTANQSILQLNSSSQTETLSNKRVVCTNCGTKLTFVHGVGCDLNAYTYR